MPRLTAPARLDVALNYACDRTPTTVDSHVQVSEVEAKQVTLHNGRVPSEEPRFETHGLQLIAAPVRFGPDLTDDAVRAAYPRIEQSLTAVTGARKALVFDHTIRRSGPDAHGRRPIHLAHADYARGSGERRLGELLPADESRAWIEGGFLIVNLWQSIDGVVHSTPVAFIDKRTVRDEDFVPVTVEYGQRQGQIGYYRYNPAHRWFWYPFLDPAEAILFKTYEPPAKGEHWSCPHAAFTSPNEPPELHGKRSSIEFRVALGFDGRHA